MSLGLHLNQHLHIILAPTTRLYRISIATEIAIVVPIAIVLTRHVTPCLSLLRRSAFALRVGLFVAGATGAMPCGPRQAATRRCASVVKELAKKYRLHDAVAGMGKEPSEAEVRAAFKKVVRVVHPDKGGTSEDFQTLQRAREAMDTAAIEVGSNTARKRPARQQADVAKRQCPDPRDSQPPADEPVQTLVASSSAVCAFCGESAPGAARGYRIRGKGVLLTFNGADLASAAVWSEFTTWVAGHAKEWDVLYYCATQERCRSGRPHMHVMLQFRRDVDCFSARFAFRGIRPNARPTWSDYSGQQRSKKYPQLALDRGFFYVWAAKEGTCVDRTGSLCVWGNYAPSWTDSKYRYVVRGDWVDKLWQDRHLSHATYREYVVLCRDRVPVRLRNLQAVEDGEDAREDEAEMQANQERIRGNASLYKRFLEFEAVTAWKATFAEDRMRYPMLVIHGPSFCGKTEFAKALFHNPLTLKVGPMIDAFPAKMRQYNRREHDAIVLDDVRNLLFLANMQHALQGKHDETVAFAETAGGTCAFTKLLFKTPIVATINQSTSNLEMLEEHDYLSKPGNVVVLRLTAPPYEDHGAGASAQHATMALPVKDKASGNSLADLRSWSVSALATFLREKDMRAAANVFQSNDVNGECFATASADVLIHDLGLTAFHARRLLQLRERFFP